MTIYHPTSSARKRMIVARAARMKFLVKDTKERWPKTWEMLKDKPRRKVKKNGRKARR